MNPSGGGDAVCVPGQFEIRLNKVTGQAQRTYHRMRLYNSVETQALMQEGGLRDFQIFGDFDGKPFTKGETSHPVYIARRAL